MLSSIDPITIIPFHPQFQNQARTLILQGLGEHWGWIDETANPDLDDIAMSYNQGYFALAFYQDQLIGTGALLPEKENVMRIVRMSVNRELRRSGIGTQLLDHLIQHARSLGCRLIVLETTDAWNDVIAFYERYGFRPVDHRDGEVHFELDIHP